MAESKARRPRKRLAIELEAQDEEVVQRARLVAVRRRLTLRHYVMLALYNQVERDEAQRER